MGRDYRGTVLRLAKKYIKKYSLRAMGKRLEFHGFLTDIKITRCFQGYKRYLKVLQTKADDVAPCSRDNALTARSPSAKRTLRIQTLSRINP